MYNKYKYYIVEVFMFRVLHLSDIHIGGTYKDAKSIACKIVSDIIYNGFTNIQCIVVTGDIFEGTTDFNDNLNREALDFFNTIIEEINYEQKNKKLTVDDVVFVPGNHDIIRTDNKNERWDKYKKFIECFYGCIPDSYDKTDYSVYKQFDKDRIAFIGFNSCHIEKKKVFDNEYINNLNKSLPADVLEGYDIDKTNLINALKSASTENYDDYGEIPMSQIRPMEHKVKELDDYHIIALFHHHFYLFPEISRKFGDSSIIRNFTEVTQHLKYMNVNTILHGHKHFDLERPYISDDYYNSSNSIIDVFAGGSVASNRVNTHSFNIIDFFDNDSDIKLIQHKFLYKGENFEIINKQVPPKSDKLKSINLLGLFKTTAPDIYKEYNQTFEKSYNSYEASTKILSWINTILTNFKDVYKTISGDPLNIFFLLYSVNYRTICYMKIVGKDEAYYNQVNGLWLQLFNSVINSSELSINSESYHKIFENKNLSDCANICDEVIKNCEDKNKQKHLACTMLGIYITDLYLVLTKYADEYKVNIKHKININIEDNKFHENVPAPRIVIKADSDRRSAYIELLCNDATAHKIVVLFIKEFDLLISKFEDYFKIIGLKLYYILPKIEKDKNKNALDNYNFEAYIPTLLRLLTGEHIYSSNLVFARELIQNSIDAISVREAKDQSDFDKSINIEINYDNKGRRFFRIRDFGTGMDRYKIERYFTSIGRSFYSDNEYDDLSIEYKPISNFGIGFLSSFMVCNEIDVHTKYYEMNSESLKLHIPNYEGCFFIELDDENDSIGTEIKLYLNSNIKTNDIVDYIKQTMIDIKYNIIINYISENNKLFSHTIKRHYVRENLIHEKLKFFIPFTENGNIQEISYIEEIENNNYLDKYNYGFLVSQPQSPKTYGHIIGLNAGIKVKELFFEKNLFYKYSRYTHHHYTHLLKHSYNNVYINFPSNWLQIDVSRDNITGLSDSVFKSGDENTNIVSLLSKTANSLFEQIKEFVNMYESKETNTPAINYQNVVYLAIDLCGKKLSQSELSKSITEYLLAVRIIFTEQGICYQVSRKGNKKQQKNNIMYQSSHARELRQYWQGNVRNSDLSRLYKSQKEKVPYSVRDHSFRELISDLLGPNKPIALDEALWEISRVFQLEKEGLKTLFKDEYVFKILTIILLKYNDDTIINKDDDSHPIIALLEVLLLNYLTIGKNNSLNILYSDLQALIE